MANLSDDCDYTKLFEKYTSKLYPAVYQTDAEVSLPYSWGTKSQLMHFSESEVSPKLTVEYKARESKSSNRGHDDSGSVRSNVPIPFMCGVYYFEIFVVSKGRQGQIGVGLVSSSADVSKLPGWEGSTYGYHGDDGNIFHESGTGNDYGPKYTEGDTVGCGVDFINGNIFFTKNGVSLGIAFDTRLPQGKPLYPCVGLKSSNEKVTVNFGHKPFRFQFADYVTKIRRGYLQRVMNQCVQDDLAHVKMKALVASYLVHHGYVHTAEAFSRWSGRNLEEDVESIQLRKEIQELIMKGHQEAAINKIDSHYPAVFTERPDLRFQLYCRQFIDMLRIQVCDNLQTALPHFNGDAHSDLPSSKRLKASNGFQSHSNKPMTSPEPELLDDVDMEDIIPEQNGHDKEMSPSGSQLLQWLEYGRKLNSMASELKVNNKLTPECAELLKNAFSLLAYTDPSASPFKFLFQDDYREQTADAINSEILAAQNQPKRPSLELAIQHLDHWMARSAKGQQEMGFVHPRMLLTKSNKSS